MGLKPGEAEVAQRGVEIAKLLAVAVGNIAGFYAELAPDGRELKPAEAAAVREHLVAVTVCLRRAHPDRDVIEFFADEGQRVGRDSDMRPTISVLRMMQRSFGLALSDDPVRRSRAMRVEELRKFMIPVQRYWRDL